MFHFFLYRFFSLVSLARTHAKTRSCQHILDGLALGLGDDACLAALVGPGEVGDGDDEEGVAGGGGC